MEHQGPPGRQQQPPRDDEPSTDPLDIHGLMSMAAVDRELAAIREHAHRSGAAPAERSSHGRHHRIGVDDWSFPSTPRPRYRRPTKKLGLAAGAGALLLVVIVSGWVMLNDGQAPPAPPPTPVSHRNAAAEAKLIALVRQQYGDQACKPVEPSGMATAEIHCEITIVAEGPESASYRIFGDPSAMTIAFAATIRAGKPVICPGNIMSPVHCPTGVSKSFWDSYR